jgi:hypothetical protein
MLELLAWIGLAVTAVSLFDAHSNPSPELPASVVTVVGGIASITFSRVGVAALDIAEHLTRAPKRAAEASGPAPSRQNMFR